MRDVKLVRKNMREKKAVAARNRRTGEMTERLTVSGATTQRDIDKLLELSNENQFGRNEAYYKLQHYEDLEEQGRLIELPCKIGDTVYGIRRFHGNRIVKAGTVSEMYFNQNMKLIIVIKNLCRGSWRENIFGTKEEAEAALKGENE